jgi:hypothetical protein
MSGQPAHGERNAADHHHDAQAVRGRHALDGGAVALGLHGHLGRAADGHREERRRLVTAGQPAQQRAARHAEAHGEGDGECDPGQVARQRRQHGRAEVQAQRGADGPLSRLARLHGRRQPRAQHAGERGREQRADHPRQRRVEDDAQLRGEECQRQRRQERPDQNTQSFSAGISSQYWPGSMRCLE